nr:hypothetical protein BaRGS_031911 [Batillaria attramentaria]
MVSSRRQENVDAAVEQLRQQNLKAAGVVCHVSKKEDRQRLVEEIMGAYGVSKCGLIALMKTLTPELAPKNIRINMIAPGAMKTKFTEGVSNVIIIIIIIIITPGAMKTKFTEGVSNAIVVVVIIIIIIPGAMKPKFTEGVIIIIIIIIIITPGAMKTKFTEGENRFYSFPLV